MISLQDVDFYKENGYLLAKGVFTSIEVSEMREAIDGIIGRAAQTRSDINHTWPGDYIPEAELSKLVLKGFHNLEYHDSCFTRAVCHPAMVAILSELIGPDVELHHSKMLVKPPQKGAAFPMHQDYPYFPHRDHTMLAASLHLDDADEENGCVHVIPGSHKSGPLPHVGSHYLDHRDYPVERGVPCAAKAGDVLFFNYLTVHGSKPNRSDRTRRNVLFQYRDPADPQTENVHVDWGQGLMVRGKQPMFKEYKAGGPVSQP